MKYTQDIVGKKFNLLTVLSLPDKPDMKRRQRSCTCLCECGNVSKTWLGDVMLGRIKSCGCLKRAVIGAVVHGMHGTHVYYIWKAIKARCSNPKHKAYPSYGGRGVTVCEEWQKSFSAFYRSVGPRPSNKHSIDRIDNDGNYEPGNVRWATRSEQQNNRRNCHRVTVDGKTMTLTQWARLLSIDPCVLYGSRSAERLILEKARRMET